MNNSNGVEVSNPNQKPNPRKRVPKLDIDPIHIHKIIPIYWDDYTLEPEWTCVICDKVFDFKKKTPEQREEEIYKMKYELLDEEAKKAEEEALLLFEKETSRAYLAEEERKK